MKVDRTRILSQVLQIQTSVQRIHWPSAIREASVRDVKEHMFCTLQFGDGETKGDTKFGAPTLPHGRYAFVPPLHPPRESTLLTFNIESQVATCLHQERDSEASGSKDILH